MFFMKSGIFTQQGSIGCYEVDMPCKKQSEVLVRTLRSSICGSDLHVGNYGWGVDEFPLPPGFPGPATMTGPRKPVPFRAGHTPHPRDGGVWEDSRSSQPCDRSHDPIQARWQSSL